MLSKLIIGLNNFSNRFRTLKARPDEILLLVPHCLQKTSCERNVIHDIDQCAHCGQCNITDIVKLRDEYGVKCNIASGGRQALDMVRDSSVKIVVAVACTKELSDGILAAFPKPVVAVPNLQPEGPCKNTRVNIDAAIQAVRSLIDSNRSD
jgi:hypothetical protein